MKAKTLAKKFVTSGKEVAGYGTDGKGHKKKTVSKIK